MGVSDGGWDRVILAWRVERRLSSIVRVAVLEDLGVEVGVRG